MIGADPCLAVAFLERAGGLGVDLDQGGLHGLHQLGRGLVLGPG